MSKTYYIYILSSFKNTTLYVGITSDLEKRMFEHKNKMIKGFTEKYNVKKLVYFEQTDNIYDALTREKQLKKMEKTLESRINKKREF